MATTRFTRPGREAPFSIAKPAPQPPAEARSDERAAGTDDDGPASVDRWWRESSYDLLRGLVVRDFTDTMPADILDEVFKK